jgi:hypothetical protein
LAPAKVDTTRPPVPVRDPLQDKLWLRVASPWAAGAKYVMDVRGIRNANGAAADARQTLTVPEPKPVPPDTTRAVSDTTRSIPDLLPAPPPAQPSR